MHKQLFSGGAKGGSGARCGREAMGICTLQPAPSTSGRSPSSPALLPHGAVPFLLHKESNHGMEAEGGSSLPLAASLGGQVTGCMCPNACELLPGSPELSDEALGTSALLGAQEIKCSQQKPGSHFAPAGAWASWQRGQAPALVATTVPGRAERCPRGYSPFCETEQQTRHEFRPSPGS